MGAMSAVAAREQAAIKRAREEEQETARWATAQRATEGRGWRVLAQPCSAQARSREELEQALAAMKQSRPSALLMTGDNVHQRYIGRIVAFTSENRLPAMYQLKEAVDRGGLMSYGASLPGVVHRAAYYVDKILRGAKPADLPVEQPTKFELVINLKTAKALGLTIPQSILVRADEIIQ
jgi:putative tryptophan/tyrosine transport system substrate-binding protein